MQEKCKYGRGETNVTLNLQQNSVNSYVILHLMNLTFNLNSFVQLVANLYGEDMIPLNTTLGLRENILRDEIKKYRRFYLLLHLVQPAEGGVFEFFP